MQKNEQQKTKHGFSVEDRKTLKASGVLDVEGFDETKIYAMLDATAFTIGGKNLKVINFSSETGELRVEGEIDSVTYSPALSRKAGILARIFR
jgi:sporulation protein YabP